MSAWNACTQEPNAWLRWIECHLGVAGFVQAIGTILAVVAAVIIASAQSRTSVKVERERENAKRAADRKSAHILALRLASILVDIEGDLAAAMKITASLTSMGMPLSQALDEVLTVILIREHWDEAIFARFDLLPAKAATTTAHLLYSVSRYNQKTRTLLDFIAKHGGSLEIAQTKFAKNQAGIGTDLNESMRLLAPLTDPPAESENRA